jgi:hypothetical protein
MADLAVCVIVPDAGEKVASLWRTNLEDWHYRCPGASGMKFRYDVMPPGYNELANLPHNRLGNYFSDLSKVD